MILTHPENKLRSINAFSLVELLVVISIIAMLIALLLPALGKARQRASMLKCQTVLRSYGLGNTAYMLDHKDYFYPAESAFYINPGNGNAYDNQRGTRSGTTYHYLLSQRYLDVSMTYTNDTDAGSINYLARSMRCPMDTDDDIYTQKNAPYCYNSLLGMGSAVWGNPATDPGGVFNWNGNWSTRNHGGTQRITDIDSPSSTPVFWDGRYGNRGPLKGYQWGTSSLQAAGLRHFALGIQEINVIFVAGNIASHNESQWKDGSTVTNF